MAVAITKLSFWGVRGSTPTVDPATWRYGGNTPCLELEAPDGTQLILDCGTGLRMLGNRSAAAGASKTQETHILITHYHWDHIQGVPSDRDRKSTRLNSSHVSISYAVFCL